MSDEHIAITQADGFGDESETEITVEFLLDSALKNYAILHGDQALDQYLQNWFRENVGVQEVGH